ncbi:MAG: PepSY domain-containing protein [Alphaproteobacteria bacterium]
METAPRTNARYYSVIWRWHFYAGLVVAPFLVILSLTGMIYLFNDEINDLIYPELRYATSAAPSKPLSAFVEAAESAFPGSKVTRIYMPAKEDYTAQLFVTTAADEEIRVFIDPPTAHVLGSFVYTQTLVGFSDVMHGSLMLGDAGDAVVELAACWSLVMVATGLYLWFPRSRALRGVWWPRFSLKRRNFWKDIHKFTGLYTAVLIVFLVISGLPWATVWGGKWLTPISNSLGLGYPEGAKRPLGAETVSHAMHDAPWTLQQAPMPVSDPHPQAPLSIDAAAKILAGLGMKNAYRLSLPAGPTGVFMAFTYPDQPEGQRTLQLDQYTGAILGDISFAHYGGVAKAVEWGVALHMGNYFGRANQILMLIPCLAIITLVTTGMMMWWMGRPPHAFSRPDGPDYPAAGASLRMAIIVFGIVFPLAGLSFLIMWALDNTLRAAGRWRHAR